MMRSTLRILLMASLLATVLSACAGGPSRSGGEGVTFVLVRHAEKATDDPEDPNLSDIGHARAQRLAGRLADMPLVAVQVTEFRRTRQTAQPTADAHRLAPTQYYANGPASELAAQWLRTYRHGAVLIVGHSNTIPGLVSALSGEIAPPMPDDEYDRLTRVHVGGDGTVRVEIERY